jgi:membrane fusion protein (multidrug efflux system)
MESTAAPALKLENASPAPKRNKKPFLILGGVVATFAAIAGIYLLATANQESTDDAQVEADVVPIAARVSGQIARRLVEDNQRVKKGDILVQIDDADFAARSKQAEAELETARAQAAAADAQVHVVEASAKGGLQSARASFSGSSMGVANAEAQLAAAKAALERAKAEARKGEMDLQRTKQLVAGNALPRERLDNAQVAYDASQAALAQAQAQVAAAAEMRQLAGTHVDEARGRLDQSTPIAAQIGSAKANADLARAHIKVAEAALDLARLQLGYTKIVASEDGLVTKLSVQAGQMIQVGQPLAELVPDRTYVVANFKETQVGRMRPGQTARVRIDAFPGVEIEARVDSVSGGTGARFSLLPPDNASGNFVKVVQRIPVRIAWLRRPEVPLQAGRHGLHPQGELSERVRRADLARLRRGRRAVRAASDHGPGRGDGSRVVERAQGGSGPRAWQRGAGQGSARAAVAVGESVRRMATVGFEVRGFDHGQFGSGARPQHECLRRSGGAAFARPASSVVRSQRPLDRGRSCHVRRANRGSQPA